MTWLNEFYRLAQSSDGLGEHEKEWVDKVPTIEAKVVELRAEQPSLVGKKVLEEIVSSSARTYSRWWAIQSGAWERPLEVEKDLSQNDAKLKAVKALYTQLKHIEIVSIILRFWSPRDFGIVSPPVAWMLSLTAGKDHVEYYMRYLRVLRKLADRYLFDNLSDVDLALWSAYHLHLLGENQGLARKMNEDPFFQSIRLGSLVTGLGEHWQGTNDQQLLLANALLSVSPDYRTASRVAAGPFQSMIEHEIAPALQVDPWPPEEGESEVGALAHKLDGHPKLRSLGLAPGDPWNHPKEKKGLWYLRNRAVHGDPEITKKQAKDFVDAVINLRNSLQRLRGPTKNIDDRLTH